MQGRLENQIKAERKMEKQLENMPKVIGEYFDNFSVTKEYKSCATYYQRLNKFLVWYSNKHNISIMDIDFTKVDDTDLVKFFKSIERKETNKGIELTSFSYRQSTWSALNSFFTFLDKKKYINGNPVRFIDRPRGKDKVEHVFLQKEDLDAMIQAVINGAGNKNAIAYQKKWKERDLAILYTFILTGMRESALCEIDMDRIDFENNILTVIDKEHKTNTYTIPSILKELYREWIDKRNTILGDTECDALFISNQKKRMSQGTVIALIKKYSKEALGYQVAPHRLRAAYGNMLYKKTGDINFVSASMKHEQISTTKIYMENNEQKVNDKVASILGEMF